MFQRALLALVAMLLVSFVVAKDGPWFVIDRFEDNAWAVLEGADGESFDVPRAWVPAAAREGDVLRILLAGDGAARSVTFVVDPVATQAIRENALRLRDLLETGPAGDIDL